MVADHGRKVGVLRDGVVRCMFCDQGVRVGQELLELEPRHATGVAGSAPVARSDPLVSPVGFL